VRTTQTSTANPTRAGEMQPEVAIIVSTYQRPEHLRRVLASIAAQKGHHARLEVVVADDGSTDSTPHVVQQFSEIASFPVHFTTAPHQGFRAAANRNRGVAASSAPYLLFLDGDCLIPPDHVAKHLAARRLGTAWTSYCVHLNQAVSKSLSVADVAAGRFTPIATWHDRFKLWKLAQKARCYSWLNHPTKPKLLSGNVGIARADFERVNGFDEAFVGWGCEDDDLGQRLRAAGVRIASILHQTHTYHLWHPKSPSVPQTWREGANVDYLHRRGKLVRCATGLLKRTRSDLQIHLLDSAALLLAAPGLAKSLKSYQVITNSDDADIEIRVAETAGRFSRAASVKLLVVPKFSPQLLSDYRQADLLLSDQPPPGEFAQRTFPLHGLDAALQTLLTRPSTAAPQRASIAA
jgi:GT2 family glycosyltransferase